MNPADLLTAAPPPFKDELVAMLATHSAAAPRSQQRALGPSEIGHPCDRKITLALADAPRCNDHADDPLPSLVGSAAHKLMEDVLRGYNERHGRRFLIEQRVYPAPGFGGTMDAYDLDTGTVIDWKFPGTSTMTKVRRTDDPGPVYRTQAHLYGLGAANLGLDVQVVRLVFIPRAGFSTGAHVWEEPWDRGVAQAALTRMWDLIAMVADLDAAEHPERFAFLPISPLMCDYCPFFARHPSTPVQCAGDPARKPPKPPVT